MSAKQHRHSPKTGYGKCSPNGEQSVRPKSIRLAELVAPGFAARWTYELGVASHIVCAAVCNQTSSVHRHSRHRVWCQSRYRSIWIFGGRYGYQRNWLQGYYSQVLRGLVRCHGELARVWPKETVTERSPHPPTISDCATRSAAARIDELELSRGFFSWQGTSRHGRPHVVQTFLEFLPSQKFASVNMVAVKQQIEAAQKRFQSQ
jgi:hypothetical protein